MKTAVAPTEKRKKRLSVSYHAITRYMERTGCLDPIKAKANILSLAGEAKPVALKRLESGGVFLFPADEFCVGKWVLIIKDGQVITCFKSAKDKYFAKP